MAIPRLSGTRAKAATSTHNANVRTIESAATIYQAETGALPADIDVIVSAGYLKEVPKVPTGATGVNVPTGGLYTYTATGGVSPAEVAITTP